MFSRALLAVLVAALTVRITAAPLPDPNDPTDPYRLDVESFPDAGLASGYYWNASENVSLYVEGDASGTDTTGSTVSARDESSNSCTGINADETCELMVDFR